MKEKKEFAAWESGWLVVPPTEREEQEEQR